MALYHIHTFIVYVPTVVCPSPSLFQLYLLNSRECSFYTYLILEISILTLHMALFHIHTSIVYVQAVVFPNPSPNSCLNRHFFSIWSADYMFNSDDLSLTAPLRKTTDTDKLWYNDNYTTHFFSLYVLPTLFFVLRSSSHLPSWHLISSSPFLRLFHRLHLLVSQDSPVPWTSHDHSSPSPASISTPVWKGSKTQSRLAPKHQYKEFSIPGLVTQDW